MTKRAPNLTAQRAGGSNPPPDAVGVAAQAASEAVKSSDGAGTAGRELDPQNRQGRRTGHAGGQCGMTVWFRNERMWWLRPADRQTVDGSGRLL